MHNSLSEDKFYIGKFWMLFLFYDTEKTHKKSPWKFKCLKLFTLNLFIIFSILISSAVWIFLMLSSCTESYSSLSWKGPERSLSFSPLPWAGLTQIDVTTGKKKKNQRCAAHMLPSATHIGMLVLGIVSDRHVWYPWLFEQHIEDMLSIHGRDLGIRSSVLHQQVILLIPCAFSIQILVTSVAFQNSAFSL